MITINSHLTNRSSEESLVAEYNRAVDAYNAQVRANNDIEGAPKRSEFGYANWINETKTAFLESIQNIMSRANALEAIVAHNTEAMELLESEASKEMKQLLENSNELIDLKSANIQKECIDKINSEIAKLLGNEWAITRADFFGWRGSLSMTIGKNGGKNFCDFDVAYDKEGVVTFNVGSTGDFKLGSCAADRYLGMCAFMSNADIIAESYKLANAARVELNALKEQRNQIENKLNRYNML